MFVSKKNTVAIKDAIKTKLQIKPNIQAQVIQFNTTLRNINYKHTILTQ